MSAERITLMEIICYVRVFVRTGHVSSSIVLTTSGSGVRCALLLLLPPSHTAFLPSPLSSVILNVAVHCGTCSALAGRVL